ncbi:hypothetical protein OY671_011615, partial [Metschnikowia pulcherrima]
RCTQARQSGGRRIERRDGGRGIHCARQWLPQVARRFPRGADPHRSGRHSRHARSGGDGPARPRDAARNRRTQRRGRGRRRGHRHAPGPERARGDRRRSQQARRTEEEPAARRRDRDHLRPFRPDRPRGREPDRQALRGVPDRRRRSRAVPVARALGLGGD